MRIVRKPIKTCAAGLLAVVAASASATATANEIGTANSGYYSIIRLGANFVEDANASPNGTRFFRRNSGEFDSGVTGGLGVGKDLGSVEALPLFFRNLRVEAEFTYDKNDFDVANSANAELTSSRFMASVYHDFSLSSELVRLRPYIGAGIGAAIIEADGTGLSNNDDTVFAYQARAGVAFRLRPGMDLHVGYRFLETVDPEFGYAAGRFETEYRSHAAEIGLRYDF